MNRWQKEVQQSLIDSEEEAVKALERQYKRALNDINSKIKAFESSLTELDEALATATDPEEIKWIQSMQRSKIYQKQYQEALKGQVSGILDKMHSDQYSTIDSYLHNCYETGYVGTMYDIAKQGIPIIQPINQAAVTKAILTDSKVKGGYYKALGVNVDNLKKVITHEISRGIASGLRYGEIARNIDNASKSGFNNAYRIARTEGHRIQQSAAYDAQKAIQDKGIDILRQWDAVLDGRTRPSHRMLDGQIVGVDEYFEIGGKKVRKPGDFGKPEEDINCRCIITTRIPEDLDEDELQTLKDRAEFFGLDKTKDLEDFRKKYLEASKMAAESESIVWSSKGEPITAEQYKDVMKYARSNGIELSGFKKFDGNIKTVYELVDDAVSVANLYPKTSDGRKKLTIVLSDNLRSVDFAETNGRIICINANAYRDTRLLAKEYNKLAESGWFVKGTDYHAIIKHEMGHVVANIYNIDVMSVAEKITGLKGSELLDFYEEHLSEYASKYSDGGEIISECFASVYGSTEKNEYALKFVEECSKIITEIEGVEK